MLCASQMASNEGLVIDVEKELDYYRKIAQHVSNMTTDTIEYTNQAYREGKKVREEEGVGILKWRHVQHLIHFPCLLRSPPRSPLHSPSRSPSCQTLDSRRGS